MNLETSVNNETELFNTIEYYKKEGYNITGKYNNKLILKKKGYSTTTLIILLLFGIILGVIYYAMNKNKHELIIYLNYDDYEASFNKIDQQDIKEKSDNILCCIGIIIVLFILYVIITIFGGGSGGSSNAPTYSPISGLFLITYLLI